MKYQSQRGVALVITLIMLSVITFLTVAFLAVSRRDRASVTTSLNQTDSRFMADAALARFQAELVSRMMARGTLLNYDLMLTRNYINPQGYADFGGILDTNNVNYDFKQGGGALTSDDRIRNIGNLFFDPRPPVYVKDRFGNTDFRFYLDYNRNGRFETNGMQPVLDNSGQPILDGGNVIISNLFVGEPEWIGVLQNPEQPHGPNNRFIGRYLYLALPISKTLDLNYIHNYAKGNVSTLPAVMNSGDGFERNQGFGSWELNFASFLVDLNTNMYVRPPANLYQYYPGNATANTGSAFDDAVSLLSYRYAANFSSPNIASIANLFPGGGGALSGIIPFQTDFIDGYTTRPALTFPFVNLVDPDNDPNLTQRPWSGADSRNQFLDPQELFDGSKTSANFTNRLMTVLTNQGSYDRYTFARLLESIGTGSAPEVRGKININYVNDPTVNVVSTNFISWTPIQFFTNVAARLFRDNLIEQFVSPGVTNYYMFDTNNLGNLVRAGFNYNNIQIFPTNEYSAPVHRLLQLAANIYDSTTSNRFPTIFRPVFGLGGGTTNIVNFIAETNSLFITNSLANGMQNRNAISDFNGFVWGVPLVVGAKKGFPGFSKFVLQTSAQISRNLQIVKQSITDPPVFLQTNQMLMVGISNIFGLEAWNSYTNDYPGTLRIIVTNSFTIALTNEMGTVIWPTTGIASNCGVAVNFPGTGWKGAPKPGSYLLPIGITNFNFLPNSQFYTVPPFFRPGITNWERGVGFPQYTWGITMTNKLVCMIIDITDVANQHVVDFVNLDDMSTGIELTKELLGNDINSLVAGAEPSAVEGVWNTNRLGGSVSPAVPTLGMIRQMEISMGDVVVDETDWTSYNVGTPNGPQKDLAIARFRKFRGLTPYPPYQDIAISSQLAVQTPFNPTRKFFQTATWQINDPLVHYTVRDLLDSTNAIENIVLIPPSSPPPSNHLGHLSTRYRPWGGHHEPNANSAETDEGFNYDFRLKDPGVRSSDDWDFPTNKFPSIGWLGRVHRGTPWQTIYMKGGAITNTDWFKWAGHYQSNPTNDWKLMDVFTTAPNDNAARGLISVNQTNLAAWSAVFGGMIVLSNSFSDASMEKQGTPQFTNTIIAPNSQALINIVNDINGTRLTNFGGVFQSLGQILAVPSLSTAYVETNGVTFSSPFVNVVNNTAQRRHGMSDEAYERIPRQMMSLLKLGEPRFVVYSYGQSLKPANQSQVLSPPDKRLFNIVTNYQITGEVATRTVLRVEGTPQNPRAVIESYNVLPAN